jgi:uncharacterized protein YdeI (YjbR/CyaY-like superfamily)
MKEALKDGVATYYAKNASDWRNWLAQNHDKVEKLWLIIYKKGAAIKSVTYNEAVDEALCFGWIDSKPNKKDDESYYVYFSQRNVKSNWSAVNKNKVAALLKANKMAPAGLAMVALAKKMGTWNALDKVSNLELPEALKVLLDKNTIAKDYWEKFAPSAKRGILEWINTAKTEATFLKRITETVTLATENIKANFPKKP